MYPILRDDAFVGTFTYKNSDKVRYYAENGNGDMFELTKDLYNALLEAEDTHPLLLDKCDKNLINYLKKEKLIHTSRFVFDGGLFNRFIIVPIGDRANRLKKLCRCINFSLPVMSVLIFAISLVIKMLSGRVINYNFSLLGYIIMILLSVLLHELGHMIAGISYNYKICNMGIVLFFLFPIGAYVEAEEDEGELTKKQKIQFSLAGIEMNLLLAGICLILSVVCVDFYTTFTMVAGVNIFMVVLNILPASELDGESALSAALGIESVAENAKKCFITKKWRRKLLHSGLAGYACLGVFAFTVISKIIEMLIIISNVIIIPLMLVI